MTVFEQEVFCECGSWKNFHDLEDNLSLDELIVLYEATLDRQARLSKVVAASFGADIPEDDRESSFLYSDQKKNNKEKDYLKPWMVDPKQGGEVTPAYGGDEIQMLPINLGYSILEGED